MYEYINIKPKTEFQFGITAQYRMSVVPRRKRAKSAKRTRYAHGIGDELLYMYDNKILGNLKLPSDLYFLYHTNRIMGMRSMYTMSID